MHDLVMEEMLGTGNWGLNVLAWLGRSPAVVRFERLIEKSEAELGRALAELGVKPQALADGAAPVFAELHLVHGAFFRRGVVGLHRDEMPRTFRSFFGRNLITHRLWRCSSITRLKELADQPCVRVATGFVEWVKYRVENQCLK